MRVGRWMVGTVAGMALAVGVALTTGMATATPAGPSVVVYKAPTCGCCASWVDHLKANGFQVKVVDLNDLSEIKETSGVPRALQSCHTAVVGGYIVEGHVPADLVQKLLTERPKVAGLAVPGMPMGSPGMEGPRKDAYEVLTFDRTGKTAVYARR